MSVHLKKKLVVSASPQRKSTLLRQPLTSPNSQRDVITCPENDKCDVGYISGTCRYVLQCRSGDGK